MAYAVECGGGAGVIRGSRFIFQGSVDHGLDAALYNAGQVGPYLDQLGEVGAAYMCWCIARYAWRCACFGMVAVIEELWVCTGVRIPPAPLFTMTSIGRNILRMPEITRNRTAQLLGGPFFVPAFSGVSCSFHSTFHGIFRCDTGWLSGMAQAITSPVRWRCHGCVRSND